ncbi:hypothetical protein CCACVL1_10699 [Corchorus capsularis]|uniref:Uncharacterized protein n=1 Tax=Corchorus capsularis TaxID=210143 RepID=A0A1R3IQ55_COCAP|nr:hypothetical protein CCACVL1_10699 [Corchorus capsularis]
MGQERSPEVTLFHLVEAMPSYMAQAQGSQRPTGYRV